MRFIGLLCLKEAFSRGQSAATLDLLLVATMDSFRVVREASCRILHEFSERFQGDSTLPEQLRVKIDSTPWLLRAQEEAAERQYDELSFLDEFETEGIDQQLDCPT